MPPTRRNLFPSHLSRRPAFNPAQDSTSDADNTSSNNDTKHHNAQDTDSGPMTPETTNTTTALLLNNGDIIARDKNGKFQLDIPILPPIPLDEEDGEDDAEDEESGAMEGIEGDGTRPSGGSSEVIGKDKDKLEDLVEMMYRNRNRHLSGEPELLNLLQQSLHNKVATLEEDNWMFEPEDDPLV
ncbi:conserved hypothetical protein [Talaromyces stipitatus ATCC 10500]|uniref:Uncharacterized protein n=1 Tax=Talaromyces stipitatus (strain ATCC 10500 / CBS 375.48 / QM 6759 / NRRL 1006) TaxID=441959 RepID=B8MSQ5_TALSN|nr:uncharacterized protein TSTA_005500 [Talaromyces stipitatus ATCC 10500]EED12513.1 conserved hypothetical protein [Talaromyces stipitatus ATCC 10500]